MKMGVTMSWQKLSIGKERDLSIFADTMVEMTWVEIQEAIKNKNIVLLPIGMIEEHGPHMDLSPDAYMAYLFCKLLKAKLKSKDIKSMIAPPFYWGVSPEVRTYPGTFSVRPETMKALLIDIFTSLDLWGVEHVFVVNSHGDQTHVKMIEEAIELSNNTLKMTVYNLSDLTLTGTDLPEFPPERKGRYRPDYHAGAIETAAMYTFYPEKVKVDIAQELSPQSGFHPLGYCGDPASFKLENSIIDFWEADLETDAMKIQAVLNNKLM